MSEISVSAEKAVSGSAPVTDAVVKTGNPVKDAIREELAALKAKAAVAEDQSKEGKDETKPSDDSESGDSSEAEAASGDEDTESKGESEGDSDEAEADEAEDSEDDSKDERVPRTRLNKEIEKTRKAREGKEKAEALVSEVQLKLDEAHGRISELAKLEAFAKKVWKAAEYMPALKEFLEKNPIFAGKEPSLEDFSSPEAYAKWVREEAEEAAQSKAKGVETEKESEAKAVAIVEGFEKEIAELRKGPMAKYVDEKHMVEIRKFLEEQGMASLLSGNTRFDSISKIAKYLFIDEFEAEIRASGRKEAVERMEKAKKTNKIGSTAPGTPGRRALPKNATLMDVIRDTIAESQAGVS